MPDYFTLAEFRALPDVSDSVEYPAERVESAAAYIVGVIEREVGAPFVTRVAVDEPHDGGARGIILDESYPQTLISVTEDGDVSPDAVLDTRGGVVRKDANASGWLGGYSNVLVTYEHGYTSAPPPDIKEAALRGTRLHLLASADNSSANSRRTSQSTDLGVENFVVAGEDRPTGYPEVDAVILGWKRRIYVPKAR